MPFTIISIDNWSPGEITSPTGATFMLNSICDMTQFVCAVVLSRVNAEELTRAFMEGTLLKFGFCIIMVIADDSEFMVLFEIMTKVLSIRLHRVAKRNYKAIDVERFHKFLNHNATIISSARQTYTYLWKWY